MAGMEEDLIDLTENSGELVDVESPAPCLDGNPSPEQNFITLFQESSNNQGLSDVIKLACRMSKHMLPVVTPIVDKIVLEKMKTMSKFSKDDYHYFAHLEDDILNNFPNIKHQIKAMLLQTTREHLKSGSFQSVPSMELALIGLAEWEDIPFVMRCYEASVTNLQQAMSRLPPKFFHNLHSYVNASGTTVEETLNPYRRGATKEVVERLKRHFHLMEETLTKVTNQRVPLYELSSLTDQVLDYLKSFGLTEVQQVQLRQSLENLKRRFELFKTLYGRFARLTVTRTRSNRSLEEEEYSEEDDGGEENTIQVLDHKEWVEYLEDINPERSIQTLGYALGLAAPLEPDFADWLYHMSQCALFMDRVWYPVLVETQQFLLCKKDLKELILTTAEIWALIARDVAEGRVSFKTMEKFTRLLSEPSVLAQHHLHQTNPIDGVQLAYRNFKILQELRHLIGPFVSALQFFPIRETDPIDELHIRKNSVEKWDTMTLAQVIDTKILRVVKVELGIDPERPETWNAMQLISSLVTDGTGSSLIEWLRKKNERDMEAMGKILQGTLLEAYGQLQTLRTRIAPFLHEDFENYQDLLQAVRVSEERLAQGISGRVQPIDCKLLANMLPEIEAAIRASVISPSEDAKEKLAKIKSVVIYPKGDAYAMEVRLTPAGMLTMSELKQAFQLLDMAVMDDTIGAEDLVGRTRLNVGFIEKLSDVFGRLFASGCITYTFREQIVIELDKLGSEIARMQDQLEEWTNHWKELEKMPLLSLISRGYLLELADMIGRKKVKEALSIFQFLLPSAPLRMENLVRQLVEDTPRISDEDGHSWLSTAQLFGVLQKLHTVIEAVFHDKSPEVDIPQFLAEYGRALNSHFIDKAIVILNVSREFLVGISLAAYISITRRPIEPSRILFVTANTDKEEVDRFMTLWSVAKKQDFFIIAHVERLSAAGADAVREGVNRVLPERRAKLLLLAQHYHRVQLGDRLGHVSDCLLKVDFTPDQLRDCFSTLLPNAANLHFFTSSLPGCGKSQQAMRLASDLASKPDYYRIPIRIGSVEELLTSLKKIQSLSSQSSNKRAAFIHLDVAHSVSLEFNDILITWLIHGAVYDPNKAKLGFWMISKETTIALEFASPFGAKVFPIISYLGQHHACECSKLSFTYDLASMPQSWGRPVTINRSNALVAAGKVLQLKRARLQEERLRLWDELCSQPENLVIDPLAEELTFDLLVGAFERAENWSAPTFSALNAMASFLYRHITAMITSPWFNLSAINLFEDEHLARDFKLGCFTMLLKVGNDCITRCWSVVYKGEKLNQDWIEPEREEMFLLGIGEDGNVTGFNFVGGDANALIRMFDPNLRPFLQLQRGLFQGLDGFRNLMQNEEDAEVVLDAMRSLLLLDGTASSAAKVRRLDNRNTPASLRLRVMIGQEHRYVLTGDNIRKMMFTLYRIRCRLPVVVFGEVGVGKRALFRFLFQTLLGHEFEVCNVNSGTSIHDVEEMINSAVETIINNPNAQVFLFFDEMNTADTPVIAFLKELMLDRHCHGNVLPDNLHVMAAAYPYRKLQEADEKAAVGLAFRFAQGVDGSSSNGQSDGRNLVYRVNEMPIAFYDHIYDFGRLCDEAGDTYIDKICRHGLPERDFNPDTVNDFVLIIQKSHRVARALSVDPESAVSLRDATRAVKLFRWFSTAAAGKKVTGGDTKKSVDLTIYLVYAFRFGNRERFLGKVFGRNQSASHNMKQVSRIIAEMLYEQAHGASFGAIAFNDVLCENLFALYVCVLNGIFLTIVGHPGSSKSLSVEILKLVLSPGNHTLRHNLGDLPTITELYSQCSPLSTSSDFKALFESARKLSVDPKRMLALVVLDELGLADMSPDKPIKVLYAELERKSMLASGEGQQQSSYSVVALSNWMVDAAQVNRGILISRTHANRNDLLTSAEQLADSLIAKYIEESERERVNDALIESFERIVYIYQEIDECKDVGGGHFISMRDFFFCVKNFVCSVFESVQVARMVKLCDFYISEYNLVQSVIRNFGGHEEARRLVRIIFAETKYRNENVIQMTPSLDLIVQNIQDSFKPLSIHIARHLMILNRSLIGLQLLNRHVRSRLDDGMSWNVLFGSCFPGDLQATAVTRKLRQVEQAIRAGGVLILCHADQLFDSLHVVLNQQYWSQGETTLTQIALGPSIRTIALPNGPFRIIVLQDTDVALNPQKMSPAILSRFEKHELRPSDLLDEAGRSWLHLIQSHPIWLAVPEVIRRQKLLCGYHEESFASLALHLQDRRIPDPNSAFAILMRAANPMAMIKLERDSSVHPELLEACRQYRLNFVLDDINDALEKIKSNRLVIMTNTLRHLEVMSAESSIHRHFIIQLFDVQTELELHRLLDSMKPEDLTDPEFCLIIQYDAVTGPIKQFQLTKYEVEQRFEMTKCRVVFIVHVHPRPVNMHWAFSFGDGWDYCFVDEVVPGGPTGHHIHLNELVLSPAEKPLSEFIRKMTIESFKSFLLEMLGPVLQTSLASLRSSLGQFYHGVRTALGLPGNQLLVTLLNECLVAQLDQSESTWNVVDAVSDPSFDASSSLTEGLWGVFKQKISNPLAHVLLVSKLWCDFAHANYHDRLVMETGSVLVSLERCSLAWQPSPISPPLQELILSDLEKNRSLAEARSVLSSAITHLHSSTEPLAISQVRNHLISDVLEELRRAEILTERHMSVATLSILNRHLKLEVCHAFGLLEAISSRMRGDDIFGGRIPEGWRTMIPEQLAKMTSQKLRGDVRDLRDTLLQLANIVASSQPVPDSLMPDKSLLYAIEEMEGPDYDGIPAGLDMENLGHLLLIVESLPKI